MRASFGYSVAVMAICAVCTFAERLMPFLIFRKGRVPAVVAYLGRVLPVAIMATLAVYYTSFTSAAGYLPQLAAVAVTAGLYLWRKSTLLSVLGGTLVYMVLVQFVFV